MFLYETPEDRIYGFLADLDLASMDDDALNKLPEDIAKDLKQQQEKGPRSVRQNKCSSPEADGRVSGNSYFHGR